MYGIDLLVCSYNESAHIASLFNSLRQQEIDMSEFLVIFVDNGSTDDTYRVVQENKHGLNVKYVYEPKVGLNQARNTGYEHSQTDYMAHIDADVKASPDWLKTICEVIPQKEPDLLGGPYSPFYTTPKPAWFLDGYNSGAYLGEEPCEVPNHEFLSGANMIWRQSTVERLGGFRDDVGLMARGLARGDETNLMVRARRELPDFRAYYHPDIRIYHLTRPELFSTRYRLRRSFAQGRHNYQVMESHVGAAAPHPLLIDTLQSLNSLSRSAVYGLLRRDRSRFPYFQNFLYERLSGEIARLGSIYERWLARL